MSQLDNDLIPLYSDGAYITEITVRWALEQEESGHIALQRKGRGRKARVTSASRVSRFHYDACAITPEEMELNALAAAAVKFHLLLDPKGTIREFQRAIDKIEQWPHEYDRENIIICAGKTHWRKEIEDVEEKISTEISTGKGKKCTPCPAYVIREAERLNEEFSSRPNNAIAAKIAKLRAKESRAEAPVGRPSSLCDLDHIDPPVNSPTPCGPITEQAHFEREADGWHIGLDGDRCILPNRAGFYYIDLLIRHAGQELPYKAVMGLSPGVPSDDWAPITDVELHFGDPEGGLARDEAEGAAIRKPGYQVAELYERDFFQTGDKRHVVYTQLRSPRQAIRRDVGRKRRELERAVAACDAGEQLVDASSFPLFAGVIWWANAKAVIPPRLCASDIVATLEAEIRAVEYFEHATRRLFGRSRKVRNDDDRAREAVCKAIRRALLAVQQHSKVLHKHFTGALKLGVEGAIYTNTDIDWSSSRFGIPVTRSRRTNENVPM